MLNTQRRPTETQESLDLPGGKATLAVPGTWHRAYSDIDRVNVAKLIEWLNHTGKSQAWLCRLSRINPGTANQVLKGTYTAPPAKFIAQMSEAIKLHEERRGKRDVPFVETSVTKLAAAVCHRARVYRNFALLVAYVGTGKTEALKQIAIANAATYMVEADPDMGPGAMLEALVTATKAEVETRGKYSQGTTAEKFRGLVKALSGTSALIIVDEAETIQPRALHYLRRLRDKAGIGIVLAGTQRLSVLIKPEHGQFDQIRSRVGFWPETVSTITREDSDAVAQAAFEDHDLTNDVLDALWAYGAGSIRVLAEDLIPAVRDFGLAKGRTLDAVLIKQVAAQVLGIKPVRGVQ